MVKRKKHNPVARGSHANDEALQCAFRFLGYRSRSTAEVRDHLINRGYSAADTAAALEKLHGLSYVDDEKFARHWAATKFISRGYGPKRIEQELRARSIPEAVIRDVVRETCAPQSEVDRARSLLEKKFDRQKLADPEVARRAAGFLQRRGYRQQAIFALLKYPLPDD